MQTRYVAVLQEEFHKIIQELSAKLEMHLPTFVRYVSLNDESIVSFYTGLPNLKVLKAVRMYLIMLVLHYQVKSLHNVSLLNSKFMVVMFKLRINPPLVDLSYRFNINKINNNKIKNSSEVDKLNGYIKMSHYWPKRENLQKTMPNCFCSPFGKK